MPQDFPVSHDYPTQSISAGAANGSPSTTAYLDRTSGQTAIGEPARPVAKPAVKPAPQALGEAERVPTMVPDLFTPSQLLDLTAASLPNFNLVEGLPWYLWANGFALQLVVTTIRDDGFVGGTISDGVNPPVPFIDGTWDDLTKKLQFKRRLEDTGELQAYTGFLFDELTTFAGSPLNSQGNPQNYWVLTGYFTSVGGNEDSNRAAAGWGWFAVAKVV